MRKILLILVMAGFSSFSFGQREVVEFIKAGKVDANKLFYAYLQPYAISLGDGLNNGWFTTAKTHKFLGFDLTVNLSAIQVPSSDRQFDIRKIGLSRTQVPGSYSLTPTVAGESKSGPLLNYYTEDRLTKLASFNTPGGTGHSLVPIPMVQVGLGTILHTDIVGRYIPKIQFISKDLPVQVSLYGIGAKNDLKIIPFLKHLPFDMASFGGYTHLTVDAALNLQPSDFGSGVTVVDYVPAYDQRISVTTRSLIYGTILSKKLGPLTFFGSVGKSYSKSRVEALGKYPAVSLNSNTLTPQITNKDALYDPVSLYYTNHHMTLNGGLRLKLIFFSVYGSVTQANYTSYNAGVCISVR
ncbi:MAG: hypothetical protein Q8862_00400 [Bacteroidota bacterium]|nr:hypothetical protein [Bacteroidota bacterium]MDP4204684.1 hypothetical protein [Bacteroidota bacterium]